MDPLFVAFLVGMGGIVALLLFLLGVGRMNKAEDAETERYAAQPRPEPEPERVLYVAPMRPMADGYLRSQGINPQTARVATTPERIRGFRGRVVVIQGKDRSHSLDAEMWDAVLATVGIGNTSVETVRF